MPLNLKVALAARQVSQEDLAARVGAEPTGLNRIINGRRKADPLLRRRIAEALNADERWLFSRVRRIPPFVHSGAGGQSEQPDEVSQIR